MSLWSSVKSYFVKEPKLNKYGWRPDLPDHRDYLYASAWTGPLPESVDLRKTCPPIYNQTSLGSCHDAATEVLTSEGWKLFHDISSCDKLATVDPKSTELFYEYPTAIIRKPYDGPMYYISHQNMDAAVTPDHMMLVNKWDEQGRTLSEDFTLIEAKDIGWYAGLMRSIQFNGGEACDTYTIKGVDHKLKSGREDLVVPMSSWCKFIGIYLAEGTVLKEEFKIQLAASKDREKTFIRELLKELGVKALELPDRFTFANKRIYMEMSELGLYGVKAPFKFVPDFVFKLTSEYMKCVLEGHYMGDGCQQDGFISHYTSSKRLADDLQRLIFLSGGWSCVRSRPPRSSTTKDGREIVGKYPEYRVGSWNTKNLSLDKKRDFKVEQYKGEVFCAEVPTHHTLVTRRNGKILISGNCTANASGGSAHYEMLQNGLPAYCPSRLFIYYNTRKIEGTVGEDSGATIRGTIKSLATYGFCDEKLWPYDIRKFTKAPPANAYAAASQNKLAAVQYMRVAQTERGLKECLAAGNTVVFGFTIYDGFESAEVAKTGIADLPKQGEKALGGHAVTLVGYENAQKRFLVRNSWGTGWGDKGYFYLPFSYLTNPRLAADFWCIKTIPGGKV